MGARTPVTGFGDPLLAWSMLDAFALGSSTAMPKLLFPILLVLSFSIPAKSQTAQLPCSPSLEGPTSIAAVTRTGVGTAYSLTATIKSEWKLQGGNTLTGFTTSRQIRDSLGRTRVDAPMACVWDKERQPKWTGRVTVADPAAQTETQWTEGQGPAFKTATVRHDPFVSLRAQRQITAQDEFRTAKSLTAQNAHAGPLDDQYKVEDLGKREIVGLEASGMRITRTQPAGAWGNSLPLIYVEEKWVSDQYSMILKDIMDDPVLGSSTYEVTNFTAGEPDASLFQPPADYEVKTQ